MSQEQYSSDFKAGYKSISGITSVMLSCSQLKTNSIWAIDQLTDKKLIPEIEITKLMII